MKDILKVYQKRLTDLSSKNRSLLLLRLVKSHFIDVYSFDFLCNQPVFHIIKNIICRKNHIKLCPLVDSRDSESNKISTQLRTIYRKYRFLLEETGKKELYIGYPFIVGKMNDGTPIRAPLIYFPVILSTESNHWIIKPCQEIEISFNKILLLAFSHFNYVNFKDSFIEYNFEDNPKEFISFFTQLYRLLEKSHFEIDFDKEIFVEKLEPFRTYTREDFENSFDTGKLKMSFQAVLGLFSQTSSHIASDYQELILNKNFKNLETFFQANIRDEDSEKPIREEEIFTPYPLDASQEEVVKTVNIGRSVVVQGPPGSGKSELICNLICNAIAQKKNVLLVCQKKVALDIVYQRLHQKNLSDFVALVHDFRGDRKIVFENLRKQIENLKLFEEKNIHFDTIYLERNFLKLSQEIVSIEEKLNEFKEALFDIKDCGVSVKELYLNSNLDEPIIEMRQEYAHFHFNTLKNFSNKLKIYFIYAQIFERPEYILKDRISFKNFDLNDLHQLKEIIKEIPIYSKKLFVQLEHILESKINFGECEWIVSQREKFNQLLVLLKEPLIFNYFRNSLLYKETDELWLNNKKKVFLNSFGDVGIENSLDKKFLIEYLNKTDKAIKASKNWIKKIIWNLSYKEKVYLKKIIYANGLKEENKPLELLMQKIDNRLNFEHHLTSLSNVGWLIDIPNSYQYESFENWFDAHIKALEAKGIFRKLSKGILYLKMESLNYNDLKKNIHTILALVKDLPSKKKIWLQHLSIKQINMLIENYSVSEKMLEILNKDFDTLCEYDNLKNSFRSYEISIIEKLAQKIKNYDIKQAVKLFENSIRIAWINHIEAKYPILREVSSPKLNQLTEALIYAIEEKRRIAEKIVLINARERTYKEALYNRLHNMVTYKDIKHQVSKKRYIWPLRKLIARFHHEIFNLLPCWMASPESVSAIFNIESLFDLVIFDEASQCFAEKAIPTIYRGKQIIVVGDRQQLPPSDLYRIRWEESTDDNADLEVDSLLDMAMLHLGQIQLRGHYRSKSMDLIHFSNRYFYEKKLKFIPDYKTFIKNESSIVYKKVNGIWKNNRNLPEADEVVNLVKCLLEKHITSIGIITFNYYQQILIQDLLDKCGRDIPDEVFVKNIENVQGDERDIIIFSIGYAFSPSGKLQVQFGSLNLPKGENRLNVAITRVKKKIYVVCSILPTDLQVDKVKNKGPIMLKAYLEYALAISNGTYRVNIESTGYTQNSYYLKDKIKKINLKNIQFQTYFPFTDLIITDSEKKSMGLIFTDDDLFYNNNLKDTFAYTAIMFSKKNWRYIRFYSRNFWKKNTELKEELISFMKKI